MMNGAQPVLDELLGDEGQTIEDPLLLHRRREVTRAQLSEDARNQ